MKTNSRFSRNVYEVSDRIWCNKHLRHTTTEKYDNDGKGGFFLIIILGIFSAYLLVYAYSCSPA